MGKVAMEVSAGLIHGLLRYVDEEWGDRYARRKARKLKAKIKALKARVRELERGCKVAGIAERAGER